MMDMRDGHGHDGHYGHGHDGHGHDGHTHNKRYDFYLGGKDACQVINYRHVTQ